MLAVNFLHCGAVCAADLVLVTTEEIHMFCLA